MKKTVLSIAKIGVVLGSAAYLAVGIVQFNRIEDIPKNSGYTVVTVPIKELEIAEKQVQKLTVKGTEKTKRLSVIQPKSWSADEEYLLAKIAMAEAEGEDVKGKALVITVVLNRMRLPEFPSSIKEVIYQKNQFSPINNGRWDDIEPDQKCYEALNMVTMGWDESQGATYFESRSDSTWHKNNLEFLFQHGRHFFYKEKEE